MYLGWRREVAAWTRWAQAGGLSPGTVRLRVYWIGRLAREVGVGPWEVTGDQLAGWLAGLQVAAETRKSALASARVFYRWAVLDGRTTADPTARLRGVRVPPSLPRPAPDVVLADLPDLPHRVRLMVDLARLAGLRRGEIAALHTRQVTAEGLRIVGKGGRVRVVPLHPALADRLAGVPAGYVFPSPAGGHLTPDRVGRLVSAALGGGGWTCHTLRHRFATRAYRATSDLLSVQQLMGHASPATTQRYTQVGSRRLVAAVAGAA